MNKFVEALRQLRASNIIFLFSIPVITYFFATSRNYLPALKTVLGVQENALVLLSSFLIVSVMFSTTFFASIYLHRSIRIDQKNTVVSQSRKRISFLLLCSFLFSLIFHITPILDEYAISIMANSADPRSSDWIIVVNQTFLLTPEFKDLVLQKVQTIKVTVTCLSLLFFIFGLLPVKFHKTLFGRLIIYFIFTYGFLSSFYFIMFAHAGFAVGLMITLRAAFFAYLGASVLGLIWALLTKLSPSKKSFRNNSIIAGVFICIGIFCFSHEKEKVSLIGNLEGKIGIISGTPQWVADAVRYGDFLEDPPQNPFKIRSLRSVDQGIKLLENQTISGLVVPADLNSNYPIIWNTDYLPKKQKNIGIASITIGVLLLLLVGIGIISNLHPLAVFSDFFVDTIRGIPMLVIILYIGLPLAGALKSASGGYINLEMLTRGVIAIAVGYSAYMAEIFRAGIEAIPKGQIEAARTLGMREYHVARFIIIPQAVAIVLPALGNEFIAMLKDTSLLSILSIRDITQRMKEFQAQSFLAFEPFNTAALLYVFLTLIAASGLKSLDKIVNRNRLQEK